MNSHRHPSGRGSRCHVLRAVLACTIMLTASAACTNEADDASVDTAPAESVPVGASTGATGDPMISTSDSGVDAAVDEATYVSVSGTGFTPGSRLEVNCEGDPNWFMLTTADDSGSFDSVQSVCWHSADFPQVIAVRDATGREASQLSDW